MHADNNVANSIAVTVTNTKLVNGAGGLASNYSLTQPNVINAAITTKDLVMSGVIAVDKIYDGTTSVAILMNNSTLEGLIGQETLTFSDPSATFSETSVGTTKTVTVTNASLSDGTGSKAGSVINYNLTDTADLTATITRKSLTITGMTASDKPYDGDKVVKTLNNGTIVGLIGNEMLTFGSQVGTFDTSNTGNNKGVTITKTMLTSAGSLDDGTFGDADNYSLTQPTDVTGVISAKALALASGTVASKVYNGSNAATITAWVLDGLVGAQTLSVSGNGTFASQNVGLNQAVTANTIALSNAGSGATAGLADNYSITNFTPTAPLAGNITAKALTITGMVASNKTYDGSVVATLTAGSIDTGIADEALTFTGQTGAFEDKNVATGKTVTVTVSALKSAPTSA